jgi:hypothetical protein
MHFYMEQPEVFVHDSSLVCRLKKSLYGLKQTLRAWYAKMDSYLLSQNFVCCSEPNVYMLRMTDSLLLLVLYVDDLLITGCSTSVIVVVKRILHCWHIYYGQTEGKVFVFH